MLCDWARLLDICSSMPAPGLVAMFLTIYVMWQASAQKLYLSVLKPFNRNNKRPLTWTYSIFMCISNIVDLKECVISRTWKTSQSNLSMDSQLEVTQSCAVEGGGVCSSSLQQQLMWVGTTDSILRGGAHQCNQLTLILPVSEGL